VYSASPEYIDLMTKNWMP